MNFRTIFPALALWLALSACEAQAQSQTEFVAEMRDRIAAEVDDEAGTSVNAEDPLTLDYVTEDGEGEIYLHRIWQYCRTNPAEDCEMVKAEFVAKITAPRPGVAAAALRLIVRDSQYLDYVKSQRNDIGDPAGVVYRQIGSDLFAILAADAPNTISLVTEDMLAEDLALDRQEAWEQAEQQTAAILPSLPEPDQFAGTAVAFEEYDYLGSLLVDLDAWARISREVGPDLFMTVVSDNFVFVGEFRDGPGFDKFRQGVAEDCERQQRCISPNVYRFRDGRWEAID